MRRHSRSRTRLLSLPVFGMMLFGVGGAWRGFYGLTAFCWAAALVMAFFDARQERAYRRCEAAGINMRGKRAGDLLFDLIVGGLILFALLFLLGVL